MKTNSILFLLFIYCISAFGQKQEHLDLLETDPTWRKEVFRFPISFAKEIPLEGIADVRFPKGWADQKSREFWSYAFGWNVSLPNKLTQAKLEEYMRIYFDGLMRVVHKEDTEIPKTIASFMALPDPNKNIRYQGSITVFDAFFTKKTMVLNVLVDYFYCAQNNRSLLLFKLSPKNTGTDVWLDLEKVKFKKDTCANC